jgi:hypothetical protein
MPIFTDGEMRRDAWRTVFSQSAEGFVDQYPIVETTRPDGTTVKVRMHTKAACGKLRSVGRLTGTDAAFLKGTRPVRSRSQCRARLMSRAAASGRASQTAPLIPTAKLSCATRRTSCTMAGAGGFEPPNGGIKIHLICIIFQCDSEKCLESAPNWTKR